MRLFWTVIAAMLTIAAPAFAEPAKRGAPKPIEQKRPATVVLASVDSVRAAPPVSTQPAAPAVKRPAPRVTTCRCGDPQADPDSEQQ